MTAEKKDRKPLRIKNLADLKRHIKLGTELVATAHQSDIAMELMRSKISVDRLTLRQKEGFLSVLPTGYNQFGAQYERVLPASSVANLYPFNFSGKTDPQGLYIGWDKYGTNILVDFDRRAEDKTTSNVLILGNSGQGKSYLLKLILTNIRESGNVLYAKIGNPYGVAGLMGNLYAESGLQPNNLQNTYEESLGYTDAFYTQAVDSGSYTNFTSDSAGYGLAQWTVEDRKTPLLAFANARGCSVADLDMQLAFLCDELETKFPGVLSMLKNAKSVREASDYVLFNFEAPLDQGESVQAQRAANGGAYYSRYGQ